VVVDNGLVTPMDPEEQARRRRYIEDMRDFLRDTDAEAALLQAARIDLAETEWESDRKYRYGLPLARPGGLERWRREALEVEQRHAAERAEREQEERRIIRERQQAAERAMTEEWADVLAQVVAEERTEQRKRVCEQIQTAVGELRAELAVQRATERGQVTDLPNPLRRRTHAA
jgi:hypothetical protein